MRQAASAVLPGLLAGAAKAAAAADKPGSATRLLGAAEAARNAAPMLHRQARWMLFEHRYVEAVERARTALGADAFAAAFAAGQTMRSDDAFLFALETLRDLQG